MIILYTILFIYVFILLLGTVIISMENKRGFWSWGVFVEGLRWPIIIGEMIVEKWKK